MGKERALFGRPPKYETPEQLEELIGKYFDECVPVPLTYTKGDQELVLTDKNGNPVYSDNPPTVAGLAFHLGFVSRQSIYDYEVKTDDFAYIVKRSRLLIEEYHEKRLSTASSPVGSIFWAKNHGWSDKQEIEHSGGVDMTTMSQEEFDRRAKEIISTFAATNQDGD